MDRIAFDYSKLKGRIIEKCGTQKNFAEQLGISEATMTSKLTGLTYFSQNEIIRAMNILSIEPGTATDYFFTPRVEISQQ